MWWRLMKCQQMRMQAPYDVAAAINAAVNASTTYRTDAQSFGVPDPTRFAISLLVRFPPHINRERD